MTSQQALDIATRAEVAVEVIARVAGQQVGDGVYPRRAGRSGWLGGPGVGAAAGQPQGRLGQLAGLGEADIGVGAEVEPAAVAGAPGHAQTGLFARAAHGEGQGPGRAAIGADPQGEAVAVGQLMTFAGRANTAQLAVGEGHGV